MINNSHILKRYMGIILYILLKGPYESYLNFYHQYFAAIAYYAK